MVAKLQRMSYKIDLAVWHTHAKPFLGRCIVLHRASTCTLIATVAPHEANAKLAN